MPANTPANAAPVRGFDDTLRAIRACEVALKRLEHDSDRELRALRRTLRGGQARDTYVAETQLFQAWRSRREVLAGELRRLKAALDDPRGLT